MRKFFQAFLLTLTCLSSWQAFAADVAPFTDHQVRAVRTAIGPNIVGLKRKANTDWDAIAILDQANQWLRQSAGTTNPLEGELWSVYSGACCGSIKEFVVRLTAGIMMGNGFNNGVVNVRLKDEESSTYRDAVRDISQHISSETPLTKEHLQTREAARSLRGHVDAVNALFAPNGRKIDPVKVIIPDPVAVSAIPAPQAVATKYEDAELNIDEERLQKKFTHTEIVFEGPPTGSIEAAVKYDNPAVVVFANTHGGHFHEEPKMNLLDSNSNQESCIFLCTDAAKALENDRRLWPFDRTGGIYASGINIVRTKSPSLASFRQDHPRGCPIGLIFSAAPGNDPRAKTDPAKPEFAAYQDLINKIVEHQFVMAIMNGHDTLITGNFGLGIFNNNGDVVADAYINCLRKFDGRIARVVFTYLDSNSRLEEVKKFGIKMQAAKVAIERDRSTEP